MVKWWGKERGQGHQTNLCSCRRRKFVHTPHQDGISHHFIMAFTPQHSPTAALPTIPQPVTPIPVLCGCQVSPPCNVKSVSEPHVLQHAFLNMAGFCQLRQYCVNTDRYIIHSHLSTKILVSCLCQLYYVVQEFSRQLSYSWWLLMMQQPKNFVNNRLKSWETQCCALYRTAENYAVAGKPTAVWSMCTLNGGAVLCQHEIKLSATVLCWKGLSPIAFDIILSSATQYKRVSNVQHI